MTVPSKLEGGRTGSPRGVVAVIHGWNVGVGTFFFRYRNALFPVIFLLAAIAIRPGVILGSPVLDRILVWSGVVVALAGEAVRLLTIGYEYIHRGGKVGQVYAGRLVQGGMYGITRNPMYLGNALIAVGMTMTAGAPVAYALLIPFFLFVYQAIVTAEEEYLRKKFATEYEDYCARVNRFVPSLRGIRASFSHMRYNWKRAIRKELGTTVGFVIGLMMIPVWRIYFLEGGPAAWDAGLRALSLAFGLGIVYGFLIFLKKHKRLFYEPPDRAGA